MIKLLKLVQGGSNLFRGGRRRAKFEGDISCLKIQNDYPEECVPLSSKDFSKEPKNGRFTEQLTNEAIYQMSDLYFIFCF